MVSWDDLCKIALSIGKGLAFLHDEKGDSNSPDFKPAIAHRDFKSKNVLIKDDLTACISDFGLAMVLEPGFSNANSQVSLFKLSQMSVAGRVSRPFLVPTFYFTAKFANT